MSNGCSQLYILIFLHQTATQRFFLLIFLRCISLYSYIKPQRFFIAELYFVAVYPYIPTSNRNCNCIYAIGKFAVYPYIPTSNRNHLLPLAPHATAVYPYIPTSNRNRFPHLSCQDVLYILIFLHQTATSS